MTPVTDYRWYQQNHASLIPIAAHLTYSPEDIAKTSGKGSLQTYAQVPKGENWQKEVSALFRYAPYVTGYYRRPQQVYLSSGPRLTQWNFIGNFATVDSDQKEWVHTVNGPWSIRICALGWASPLRHRSRKWRFTMAATSTGGFCRMLSASTRKSRIFTAKLGT